jgi:hypothetical protein
MGTLLFRIIDAVSGFFDQVLIGLSRDGTPQYLPADTLYAEVYAESTALPRASKNELRQNFIELRKLNGWKIVEVWW